MVTTFLGVPLMKIENCTLGDFYATLKLHSNKTEIYNLANKIKYDFKDRTEPMTTENVRRNPGVSSSRAKEIFALAEELGYKVLKLQTVYI